MQKPKQLRIRKFECRPYQKSALNNLDPPEEMKVSEWAQKYRMLDGKTSAEPGPWNNDRTPYLVEVMDELLNYETEEIIFCKCTQVGGTEVELNMMGYTVQQDPSPVEIVYPTETLANSVSEKRIKPMIESTPTIYRKYDKNSGNLELDFDDMFIKLVWSNSPSGLASFAMKYLFLDEVDKYPGAGKKEADPISLAKERTKTYRNSKIYMTSTPTISEGHIWKNLIEADVEKHYFVQCPHCGEYIELKFKQLKWPEKEDGLTNSDRADRTVYVCQECGCIITDCHKDRMLRHGRWQAVRERNTSHRKVGFWINTLYSPFVRFSQIAMEYMNSKDDPEKYQNFVNSWLAEPWEDTKLKTSADTVMERQTRLPALFVPAWAKLLTGGVDVQETCLYWTVRAFGNYITSQNIAHGQAASWAEIERIMNLAYEKENGERLVTSLCLIDSGYDADSTYDFCANNADWALPVKGSSNPMATHFKMSKINKSDSKAFGMTLVLVDGDKYKDMIAARMKKQNGRGAWMVYEGCDMDYAEQVTAEHKVNVKVGTKTVKRWKLKHSHADNHYLDAEVYALAAADIMNVRYMHLEDAQDEGVKVQQEEKTDEESWIEQNESWI